MSCHVILECPTGFKDLLTDVADKFGIYRFMAVIDVCFELCGCLKQLLAMLAGYCWLQTFLLVLPHVTCELVGVSEA